MDERTARPDDGFLADRRTERFDAVLCHDCDNFVAARQDEFGFGIDRTIRQGADLAFEYIKSAYVCEAPRAE